MLTRKRPVATQPIASSPRLVSSKHLDLVLLACCSCLLSLMCHSTANLLPQATSITPDASQAASAGQTNFYVRSALLSAYQSKGKSEGSEDS